MKFPKRQKRKRPACSVGCKGGLCLVHVFLCRRPPFGRCFGPFVSGVFSSNFASFVVVCWFLMWLVGLDMPQSVVFGVVFGFSSLWVWLRVSACVCFCYWVGVCVCVLLFLHSCAPLVLFLLIFHLLDSKNYHPGGNNYSY